MLYCHLLAHCCNTQIHADYNVWSLYSVQPAQSAAVSLTLTRTQSTLHYQYHPGSSAPTRPHLPSRSTCFAHLWNVSAGPGRQTQAEAEGQAVHPPAWLGVRSLSPDRPHRLLPPCRGWGGCSFRLELPLNSSVWQREG